MAEYDSRGRGKRRQQVRAERTTPARDGHVIVDNTRTFLAGGAFVETMIDPDDGEAIVRADLAGAWSKRVTELPDEPVLMMTADGARDIGRTLLAAADAADKDAAEWKRAQS